MTLNLLNKREIKEVDNLSKRIPMDKLVKMYVKNTEKLKSKAKKILVYEPRTSGSPEPNDQLCSAALPNVANTPQEIISVLKFWIGKIKFILFE